ncbi:MAG TPA: hypothetical protein PK253_12905 [Spirochaetota bacterium]|nr:hypothetical protein [Spirochaetota bacterium]HPQ54140.1 hypothetical protein [Spirochaetota bacterium]
MKKRFLFLIAILSVGLISCGGTWVDVPGPMGACTDKDVTDNDLEKGFMGMGKTVFQSTCMQMQKQYAGEYRCNDGQLQVKCK